MYDAWGNLISSTGTTENSYLYCAEQLDSTTGLYYLRARYMNPTTGTFISMDTYQGSIFEPATLHKYLYANANPVMYNDPSGNMFASIAISSAINSIQEKMHTLNEMAIYKNLMAKLRVINTVLTIYDTGRQVFMILNDPEIPNSQIAEAIARGIFTAICINFMCEIKALEPYVKLFVIGYGMYGQGKAIEEAAENGQWDLVIVRSLQLFIQVMSLPQSCFTGDTLVATEDGQIRIDEIEVGDKVWAYDIFTGETALKEVTKVYVHEVDEILHLHTSCGDIDTTTNHPFYVIDKGWVAAGDINEGDEVYLIDGSTAFITGAELERLSESIKVYNLEVADFNTYFVGDVPVLVHNYQDGDTGRRTNKRGEEYPSVTDPRTGKEIPCPEGSLSKVPEDQRVEWDNYSRYEYIKEWNERGYEDLDWSKYDIHHILPRAFGGTNDFDNLVPLLRDLVHPLFTRWWSGF